MAEVKTYEVDISTKQAQENVDELNKSLEAQVDLIDDIEKEIRGYEKQLEKTSKTDLAARKKINDKIKETKERLKDEKVALNDVKKEQQKANQVLKEATENQAEYSGALGLLDNQLGGAIGKITGMTQAVGGATKGFNLMKIAIIGTGIGALIIALTSLTAAFTSSEKGQNKFAKIMGVIGSVVDNVTTLLSDLGLKIISVFEDPKQAIIDLKDAIEENITNRITSLIDTFGFLGSAIKKVFQRDFSGAMEDAKKAGSSYIDTMTGVKNTVDKIGESVSGLTDELIREGKIAAKIADQRAKATELERDLIVQRAEADRKRAELLEKAVDKEKYNLQERIGFLEEAGRLEEEITNKEIEAAQLRLEAKIAENKQADSTTEDLNKEAELKAQLIQLETARLTKAKEVTSQIIGLKAEERAKDELAKNEKKAETEAEILEAATNEERRLLAIKAITDKYKLQDDVSEIEALEIEKGKRLQELEDLNAHWMQKAAVVAFYNEQIANKTKEVNDEVSNEAISQAEREKQARIATATSMLSSLNTLAEEGSALSKGVAIAQATMSTYQAAVAAYAAGSSVGGAAGLVMGPIAAGLAVAAGLANIKKIVSTKPGTRGNQTPPSQSGPPTVASIPSTPPSFNVVGANGTNQLADAIGGQAQTPTRAYVVSSDVTSAQELDRNIVEGASIG